jgi:hypothetical protein
MMEAISSSETSIITRANTVLRPRRRHSAFSYAIRRRSTW